MLRGMSQLTSGDVATLINQAGANRLLWSIAGANMNSTADQPLTKSGTFNTYIIDRVIAYLPSTSMTTAQGGLYTAASKGGAAVVLASQNYAALQVSSDTLSLTLARTDLRSEPVFILSLTTPQGVAATANFAVYGWPVS